MTELQLLGFYQQDYPEKVQRAVKLLLKLVKHNPDLHEGAWLYTTANLVICMAMRGPSG
jgi:hypothetical protein